MPPGCRREARTSCVANASQIVAPRPAHCPAASITVLPLDDEVLDLLLERNPIFIEECRQIRERMRQGDYVTCEEALQMFRADS